jgi:trehalose 6-phosphate synthase
MLALLDPSRQAIAEYVEYGAAIEREARAVNERFGDVIELRVADDFPRSVAAYKQYDVLLVNAVYDGLNLVAKEGPLVNERDGVLVLSENTGAHEELGAWAVSVSPFDVWGQAEALHEALSMPQAERARRLGATKAHVREHDLARWLEAQLADLTA